MKMVTMSVYYQYYGKLKRKYFNKKGSKLQIWEIYGNIAETSCAEFSEFCANSSPQMSTNVNN